jgi:hypothetical protein
MLRGGASARPRGSRRLGLEGQELGEVEGHVVGQHHVARLLGRPHHLGAHEAAARGVWERDGEREMEKES